MTLFIFSEGSCYKNNLPGNLISEGEKEAFVSEEVALTAALCLPCPHYQGGAAKVRGEGPTEEWEPLFPVLEASPRPARASSEGGLSKNR